MGLNVWSVFSAVAASCGEREAIVSGAQRMTYRGLAQRAAAAGAALGALAGHAPIPRRELAAWECGQPTVGTYLPNCPEYLEVTLGALAARCAPFNINYRYTGGELAHLLSDARTGVLVFHSRFAPLVAEVLTELPRPPALVQVADDSGHELLHGAVDYEAALAATPGGPGEDQTADDLMIVYTGGTTGRPKGTLWRQGDLMAGVILRDAGSASAAKIAAAAASAPAMRFMPLVPLMHGAGLWSTLRALCSGATVVLNRVIDHLDPEDVWELVEAERVGALVVVGEAVARPLLDQLESATHDASSLVTVVNGGAVLSAETKQRFLDRLPGLAIIDTAGATESGANLSQTSVGAPGEPGVFVPSPSTAVLDRTLTRRLRPGEDEVGWLAASGPIPSGYLGDEASTKATFPTVEGVRWSVPGDRARLRADGTVQLLGRDATTINSGGEKIFAEEVEQAVLRTPGVRDALVVGRPSERWGTEVVAVIDADAGVTDEAITAVVGRHLARFKVPKAYVRVEQVRRSPAGKADYGWVSRVVAVTPARTP